ncbi:hypothetical protein [Sphingomonas sp. PB1R3]|uniref:hypothetical protein n=1 Tax=Sphingomonas flavida TaxID=3096154 RepID=UPI002FC9D929
MASVVIGLEDAVARQALSEDRALAAWVEKDHAELARRHLERRAKRLATDRAWAKKPGPKVAGPGGGYGAGKSRG